MQLVLNWIRVGRANLDNGGNLGTRAQASKIHNVLYTLNQK